MLVHTVGTDASKGAGHVDETDPDRPQRQARHRMERLGDPEIARSVDDIVQSDIHREPHRCRVNGVGKGFGQRDMAVMLIIEIVRFPAVDIDRPGIDRVLGSAAAALRNSDPAAVRLPGLCPLSGSGEVLLAGSEFGSGVLAIVGNQAEWRCQVKRSR